MAGDELAGLLTDLDHLGENEALIAAEMHLALATAGIGFARREIPWHEPALAGRSLGHSAVLVGQKAQGSVQDQVM